MKDYLKKEYFSLYYNNPRNFVESQWGLPQPVYMIYRLVTAAYLITWLAINISDNKKVLSSDGETPWKFLIYLTFQGFIILTFTFIVKAIFTAMDIYLSCRTSNGEYIYSWFNGYFQCLWVLNNVATTLAFFITVAFWTLLYNGGPPARDDIILHGTNSVLAFLDLLITAIPFRMIHVYQPIFYAWGYVLFSAIYSAAGGTGTGYTPYIYNVLDWRDNQGEAWGTVAGCAVGVLIIHGVVCLVYTARMYVFMRTARGARQAQNLHGESNLALDYTGSRDVI